MEAYREEIAEIVAKICGDPFEWPKVRKNVLARFIKTSEGWRNSTHDEVASNVKDFRASQSEKGRKGAAARWHSPANGPAISPANDLPLPLPLPLPLGSLSHQSVVGGEDARGGGSRIERRKKLCVQFPRESEESLQAYRARIDAKLYAVQGRSVTQEGR